MNESVKWQKIALTVLCAVLALVLVVLIFATTYVHHLLDQLGHVTPGEDDTLSSEDLATATESLDPDYTGEVVDPTDIIIDTVEPTGPSNEDMDIINILLVGQDRREGEPRQRSDVMMLCTFNPKNNTIHITSFLRDSYVSIPGHGNRKLNSAYQLGGFTLLNETMALNFGVHVDANIEVDFFGFRDIIDMLGGVDITLTKAEVERLNSHGNFEYGGKWNLKPGLNHLTGDQALAYSRMRYVATGNGTKNDFGRTERQRAVISALIEAYKNQSVSNMLGMVDDILPLVKTNMTNNEILNYVVDLFPMLSSATITNQAIPGKGTYSDKYVDGIGSVLVLDLPEIRDQLQEMFQN